MNFLTCLIGIALLAGCSDDTAPTGGGGTGGDDAGGASGAGDCDGVACADNEVCAFEAGTCDGPRSCQEAGCGDEVACGCDGENYQSACDAMAVTGGVSSNGACAPPDGQFICTYEYQLPIYCELGSEYCKVEPTQSVYMLKCEPQPETCDAVPTDCDCLADTCSENYCGIDESNGSLTVLCPLPM